MSEVPRVLELSRNDPTHTILFLEEAAHQTEGPNLLEARTLVLH